MSGESVLIWVGVGAILVSICILELALRIRLDAIAKQLSDLANRLEKL